MHRIAYLYALIALSIVCACNNAPTERVERSSPETIEIVAQEMPAAAISRFKMKIDKGLGSLEILNKSSLELDEDDLILGIISNEEALAIPIRYLAGFEVANLKHQDKQYLLSWCPLVGTAQVFEGKTDGANTEFDFAWGLIHNNLLMVDQKTKTVWAQISGEAINGNLEGDKLKALPSLQTTWRLWKTQYPNTRIVVNKDTSGAPFPAEVYQKEYYANFIPGSGSRVKADSHDISHLGLGLNLGDKQVYFPFKELEKATSPFKQELEGKLFNIYFDLEEYTAWIEDEQGDLIAHTIVYQKPWFDFYPNSKLYVFE